MTILVVAEYENGAVAPATLNTVAAAAKIGGDVHVLVAGQNVGGVAESAAKIAGVAKVLVADNAAYAHVLPENVAPLIVELAKGYSHVLAPATTNGKNILPRVAALLDVDQISEIISVDPPTPSSARSMPVTPLPPCNRALPSRSSPCVPPASTPWPPKVVRLPSKPLALRTTPASRPSLAKSWPSPTAQS
jgi:Electron transfer flavoprotein, alpha subunit